MNGQSNKTDLTINKIYDVYIINDDFTEEVPYSGFRFKKLEEFRDEIKRIDRDNILNEILFLEK